MKQKKIVTILLLLVMFLFIAGCGKVSENRGVIYDVALESKMEAETENETNIKEESAAEVNGESGKESTNDTEQLYEEYSYYVDKKELYSRASSMFLDIERPEGIEYAPVILVDIPDNSKKEERINEIILRQCARTLPMDQEWLYSVEIQITYRSEKYLCYEYVSHTALPEGYDATQLYATIDIEEERWIEYPPGAWWCKNGLTGERCMLDDLFEKQGLLEWLNSNIGSKGEQICQFQLSRSILPEEKFIENGYEKGYSAYYVVLEFC